MEWLTRDISAYAQSISVARYMVYKSTIYIFISLFDKTPFGQRKGCGAQCSSFSRIPRAPLSLLMGRLRRGRRRHITSGLGRGRGASPGGQTRPAILLGNRTPP